MSDDEPSYGDRTAGLLLGLAIGGLIGFAVGVWGVPYAQGFWGGLVVSFGAAGWWATS